jgi:hypothetical protein
MNKLNKTMMLLALSLPLHATGVFAGTAAMSIGAINENAETCYQQTVAANEGADPGTLSVKSCDRVLNSKYLSKQLESATLVNRAIIQTRQADYTAAEKSVMRALQVSPDLENAEVLLGQIERLSAKADQHVSHQTVESDVIAKQI